MSTPVTGVVHWLGQRLSLSLPDPTWVDRVQAFTGLTLEPASAPLPLPLLAVTGPQEVVVDHVDRRHFRDPAQLEVWLMLTISDVLLERGGHLALHAACLVRDGAAVLLTAPPWSGKSSWALAAARAGWAVAGDDQVVIRPDQGHVIGLPRPFKRRLLSPHDEAVTSPLALRGEWEGERLALEPRPLGDAAAEYPVGLICHLERHAGPGVRIEPLAPAAGVPRLMRQIRGVTPTFLRSVAAAGRFLAACPNVRVSVGDGEIAAGLAAVKDWAPDGRCAPAEGGGAG